MKVSYLDTIIESICLHKVGNKIADEGVKLSKKHLIVQDNIKNILLKYFINSSILMNCLHSIMIMTFH